MIHHVIPNWFRDHMAGSYRDGMTGTRMFNIPRFYFIHKNADLATSKLLTLINEEINR